MTGRLPQVRVPVRLRCLFPNASFVGCADIRVADATEESGHCGTNSMFVAIPGTKQNGADFVNEAINNGAKALMVSHPLADVSVPQCVVPKIRRAYAELTAALAGSPSRHLEIVGVTGTNGKTTVAWMVRSILQLANKKTGLLGTIEYHDGDSREPASLTTPDSKTISNWLARMVLRRTTHVAMEISSHALDQDRCAGTKLDVAVVTNITQDHFDYHRNSKSYIASKARIFDLCKPGATVVLNADDPCCQQLKNRIEPNLNVVTFGLSEDADVHATIEHESFSGSHFVLHIGEESIEVHTPLVGRHNIANCLAAAAVATRLGISSDLIAAGIQSLEMIPGRLEHIDCGQPFDVFVDYAHTDDALARSVDCMKQLSGGRTFCVFGAGGDRDRTKRPLMAKAAAHADVPVVTSDNPRTEPSEEIIDEILDGFAANGPQPHVEADRRNAIRWALHQAQPGDCVLIAGKGHETTQTIGKQQFPFDDRQVVREELQNIISPPVPQPVRLRA